uniref:ATP synthase F0 subunit 8 n=1 Tax=Ptychadena anchietae TaxID=127654 RepID=UPI00286CEE11|nr:ATP synthase F0 subunit 8 [Ptychadena anchietae]WKT09017.1 ATP synthase F0 subunit 8 [Ptychadena anchietae]
MPQLLPDPWFWILASSWAILLLVAPTKILTHLYPNDFSTKPSKTLNPSWTWLW